MTQHPSATLVSPPRWLPGSPVVVDDVDISEHLLVDIALRHVSLRGTCTIHLLSSLMKLSLELTEGLFRRLIDQQMFEVRRMSGDDYVFALSPTGRRMTIERSANVRYAGSGFARRLYRLGAGADIPSQGHGISCAVPSPTLW